MERIFGSIPAILGGLGANDAATEALVFAAWEQAAGDLIRDRTKAAEYFENRLVVHVEDRTWQLHLEDLAPQMLAKVNTIAGQGSVKRIEFRIEPRSIERLDERDDNSLELPPIDPKLDAAAASIADDHLRQQFLEAAAVYLARK